jgi:hypothetical protein
MQYRDHEIRYDSDSEEFEEAQRQQNEGKQYRTKRSAKPSRRRASKSQNQPGCGISARRNHRWSW